MPKKAAKNLLRETPLSIKISDRLLDRIEAARARREAESGHCTLSDAARTLICMGLDRDEGGK